MNKPVGWAIATAVDFILVWVMCIATKRDYMEHSRSGRQSPTLTGKALIAYMLFLLGILFAVTTITTIILK